MRGDVVVGTACLGLGIYVLVEGLVTYRVGEGVFASIWLLMMAAFLLYYGIPLELRERRHRARRKRWDRLDKELKERDKKKREVR